MVHHQPNGPAFDIVLILHVGCAVVSLVTVATSASIAGRLGRLLAQEASWPESVSRYLAPGVNWAGRSIYGIPIFGFALLALSHGAYSLRDGWITAGLVVLIGMVLVAEGSLWPAERRLQESFAAWSAGNDGTATAPALGEDSRVRRDVRSMLVSAGLTLALLVLGTVLMVAQP